MEQAVGGFGEAVAAASVFAAAQQPALVANCELGNKRARGEVAKGY